MMSRVFVGLALLAPALAAAEPRLTLDEALAQVAAQHPQRRADAAEARRAGQELEVERAGYVPDVELFLQLDRSTANAAPGAVFPATGLPNLIGVPGRAIDLGDWGSAVGATVSWDALGPRTWDARIEHARAEARLARDEAAASTLDLDYTAADRFIVVIGRGEAVKAARAGVDRAQVFLTIVHATVGSDLRAGADLSRAEAELALAQTALARAETARATSVAELAEALGQPRSLPEPIPGGLERMPPRGGAAAGARDPRLDVARDREQIAEAARAVTATGTLPKLLLVGAAWGRGSGELTGGASFAHGLLPDVPNWALGVVLRWPVLAGRVVAPQTRADAARIAREQARADVVAQQLAGRGARADALVDGSFRVVDATPAALRAAREAEQQITARYKAQLATADDVAQAQRLLVQAETEDALARLDVWRALLFRAYAAGDLAPFLALLHGGP